MNLLNNKYVLYFIAFISVINILGYFFDSKFGAIAFFGLVAFLSLYFTNNMIIVLGVSLLATNFLGGLAELFKPMKAIDITPNNNKERKEGFTNQDEEDKLKKEKNDTNVEGTRLTSSNLLQPSAILDGMDGMADQIDNMSETFKKAQNTEQAKDFLDSNINAENIKEIQKKTDDLMKEQNQLMSQVADFGPLLNKSLKAISNLTTGNIGSVIGELTGTLDQLYGKYPEAFPSDYKEQTKDIRNKMSEINNVKDQINEAASKENPQVRDQITDLSKQLNI